MFEILEINDCPDIVFKHVKVLFDNGGELYTIILNRGCYNNISMDILNNRFYESKTSNIVKTCKIGNSRSII